MAFQPVKPKKQSVVGQTALGATAGAAGVGTAAGLSGGMRGARLVGSNIKTVRRQGYKVPKATAGMARGAGAIGGALGSIGRSARGGTMGLAAGAGAGLLGATALKNNRKIQKSDTVSAFGVDHG